MSDISKHRPADDDIRAAVAATTLDPSDAFRSTLRSQIVAEADGDAATTLRPNDERRSRSRWPLYAAAAAVVALVVTLAVVTGRGDDREFDPAVPPSRVPSAELDENALRGDELVAELQGRRWLALERFDDPSPTALTHVFEIVERDGTRSFDGSDGCNAYEGMATFDGVAITSGDLRFSARTCGDIDTLPIDVGQQVEVLAGADKFVLRAADGTPLARFTDAATLLPADRADIPFSWFVDDLDFIEFTDTGRASIKCTLFTWVEVDGRIEFRLDERQPDCSVVNEGSEFSNEEPIAEALAEIAVDGAEILRASNSLVVVGGERAVLLRTIPPVNADPAGATVAAGAIFGLEPGIGVTPEQFLDAAAPVLGEPDVDTGWILERDQQLQRPVSKCDLADYREIVWGDLVAGFWGRGSRTMLDHWYVGDPRILAGEKPAVERPAFGPSDLRTEHGVAVGDSANEIPDAFNMTRFDTSGDRFDPGSDIERIGVLSANPAATGANLEPGARGGGYLIADGVVIAFGNEAFGC